MGGGVPGDAAPRWPEWDELNFTVVFVSSHVLNSHFDPLSKGGILMLLSLKPRHALVDQKLIKSKTSMDWELLVKVDQKTFSIVSITTLYIQYTVYSVGENIDSTLFWLISKRGSRLKRDSRCDM